MWHQCYSLKTSMWSSIVKHIVDVPDSEAGLKFHSRIQACEQSATQDLL